MRFCSLSRNSGLRPSPMFSAYSGETNGVRCEPWQGSIVAGSLHPFPESQLPRRRVLFQHLPQPPSRWLHQTP